MNLDNLKIGLLKTFPNINFIIKKNFIPIKNQLLFCNIDCNDYHDKIILLYSNPIFEIKISHNEFIFKTMYLSPTMYFINKYYKQYNKINDLYYFNVNSNPSANSNELVFNLSHMIPIEYINMLFDFYDCSNYEINKITIKNIDNDNNFISFIENIEKFNINSKIIKESYMDYKKDIQNLSLKIFDSNWILIDKNCKILNMQKNYSDIVNKFFNFVKYSKFKTLDNFNYINTNNEYIFYKPHEIETIYKSEGGINLSSIFLSFGYSQFVNTNMLDYYANFIRHSSNDDFENIYSGANSDLLCLVVFNEILNKFGLVTELKINSQVYSNKSNTFGSEIYYWLFGYYNKRIL